MLMCGVRHTPRHPMLAREHTVGHLFWASGLLKIGPAGIVLTCAAAGAANIAVRQMAIRLASPRKLMTLLPNPQLRHSVVRAAKRSVAMHTARGAVNVQLAPSGR
jgi:hypothetical protein